MPGFREEQPPFHKEAECGTRYAKPGQDRPSHSAHHESKKGCEPRERKTDKSGEVTKSGAMSTRDTIAHFLEQIIILRMWRLEYSHSAAIAERGRAGDGARSLGGVYPAPILLLHPP